MSATAETVSTTIDFLRPIDAEGLTALSEKGKANPTNVVTLKATTVCEGQFRNMTYVRNLAPMLIDEPPHLLAAPGGKLRNVFQRKAEICRHDDLRQRARELGDEVDGGGLAGCR